MQPSKSMVDNMMELNRLFLKMPVNDVSTPNAYQPLFRHPTPNYSSSSTDSYSPETFPELSYNRSNCRDLNYRPSLETRSPETPLTLGRPIVGKRILGNTYRSPVDQKSPNEERFYAIADPRPITPYRSPINSWIDSNTSPNVKEQRCYQLFPEEKTPLNMYSNMSPSSSMSQNSFNSNYGMLTPPRNSNPFMANSPNAGVRSPMNLGASTSGFQDGAQKMCTFCRKNGETPLVYMTHAVKEKRGNRNIVTCPILRSHVCDICGVSGDDAHTITYCPVLRSNNNGMPLKSTTITLKNTRIKSNGRRRY